MVTSNLTLKGMTMFRKQAGELIVITEGLKRRVYDLATHDIYRDVTGTVLVAERIPNSSLLGDTVAFFPIINVQAIEIHPQIEGLES